jgi:hypothetical protein
MVAGNLAGGIAGGDDAILFSLKNVIGDTVLSEIHEAVKSGTGEGTIWLPTDPVHLSMEVYSAVGEALMAGTADAGIDGRRPTKRARLESVVAQAAPPLKRGAANVRLPDWLLGRHGPGPVRGRGRGFPRSFSRGFNRGPIGGWRAPRGGGRGPRRY